MLDKKRLGNQMMDFNRTGSHATDSFSIRLLQLIKWSFLGLHLTLIRGLILKFSQSYPIGFEHIPTLAEL